jgi:hypothetical protein
MIQFGLSFRTIKIKLQTQHPENLKDLQYQL